MLAGRYRLDEQATVVPADPARSRVWNGVDTALDRPVEILLLDPAHPHAADVLDAARRAALVDDPRLARVLDVGREPHGTYVVLERLAGRELSVLVRRGPLPPETARRIAGECADALDVARRRGLHHLALTPRHVVVRSDGQVRLRGLAVDAAATGRELDAADTAARLDAVDLVRLLYTGLTGRWPGRPVSGVEPAPLVAGRPVPPGDLAGTVPVELDRLCRVVLGEQDGGPRSPGETAAALAPWAAAGPVTLDRALDPSGPVRPPTGELPVVPPAREEPAFEEVAFGAHPTGAAEALREALPVDRPVPRPSLAPALSALAGRFTRTRGPGGDRADGRAEPDGPPPGWSDGSAPDDDVRDDDVRDDDALDEPASRETLATAPAAPVGTAWEGGDNDTPLGPLGPEVPLSRPPQEQTRVVLMLVLVLVVLGLVVGLLGLRGLGGATSALLGDDEDAPLVQPTPTAPASPSPTATATPTAPAAVTPVISGISPIDPQGDGEENDDRATRAIDGNPSTSWQSKTYRSRGFGNLKDGVGLVLELEAAATVTSVTLDIGGDGGAVELRTTTQQEDVEGTTVVATGEPDGSGRLVLTPAQPVAGAERLLLWFTSLPRVDGEYRALVSEVTVR